MRLSRGRSGFEGAQHSFGVFVNPRVWGVLWGYGGMELQ